MVRRVRLLIAAEARRQAPRRVLAALALTVGALSCGGGGDSAPSAPATPAQVLARVVVSLPSDTIKVGQSSTASAAGFDQVGRAMSIAPTAWSTELSAVATVSSGGVVVGVAPGFTTLRVFVGETQGYRALTVIPMPVARVQLSPTATSVNIGLALQLQALLTDATGSALSGRTIAWSTSDASKATVSASGLVIALAAGAVTITASCEGFSALAVISVTQTVVRVASVVVSPTVGRLVVGQAAQLAATLRDAAGNLLPGRTATWTSSAANVATVSATGLVRAVGGGTAIVTAAVDGTNASATITSETDLAISIAQPDTLAPVNDTLRVWASVQTLHGLESVRATVSPVGSFFNTALVKTNVGRFTPNFVWLGRIVIRDLGTDDYYLVVTATDSLGTVQTGSVRFHHEYAQEGGTGSSPGKKVAPAPLPAGVP